MYFRFCFLRGLKIKQIFFSHSCPHTVLLVEYLFPEPQQSIERFLKAISIKSFSRIAKSCCCCPGFLTKHLLWGWTNATLEKPLSITGNCSPCFLPHRPNFLSNKREILVSGPVEDWALNKIWSFQQPWFTNNSTNTLFYDPCL